MEYKYEYRLAPRHSDFDFYQMAHHSKYFCWFEEARFALFSQLTKAEDILLKYKLPVTNINCKYLRMVCDVGELRIKVNMVFDHEKPVIHFYYRLMDGKAKKLHAKGWSEHAFLDQDNNLLTMMPEDVVEIFHKLETIPGG